ncbi:MAG TPA: 50S ribosomal protein L11 methyltransferase [Gemmatimonadaceae bacterium]|nr:50S ribosomal protein L11 methyltransferase [Gemmatimonadaceae bacterium]
MSSWIALRVRASAGERRDDVVRALFDAGSLGVQEDGDWSVTHFPSDTAIDDVRSAVLRADPGAELRTERTPDVDWSEAWRDQLHLHSLGALTVAPPWLADGLDPARTIVIEPGMAFGTGEHPTTRGVVRLMQDVIRDGDRVADLGAGSAVLAIAAAKLGAASVAAIELDPDAIGDAEENARRNGVAHRVSVICGDAMLLLPLVAPVRVVLANIISSVIAQLLPAVARALEPDGRVILAGILREEQPHMASVLRAGGWRVVAEDVEDIWWSATVARS